MPSFPFRLAVPLAPLALCSCYLGTGVGGAFPVGAAAPAGPGPVLLGELGLQYDYRRTVRVLALGSGQPLGGARFVANGEKVRAPFYGGLGLDLTLHRRDDRLFRLSGRLWPAAAQVKIGPAASLAAPTGWRVRTAFLGATWQWITDDADEGPMGLNLSAGLLVQRVTAEPLDHPWTVAPVLLVAVDFGWKLLDCWFLDVRCPQSLLRIKN